MPSCSSECSCLIFRTLRYSDTSDAATESCWGGTGIRCSVFTAIVLNVALTTPVVQRPVVVVVLEVGVAVDLHVRPQERQLAARPVVEVLAEPVHDLRRVHDGVVAVARDADVRLHEA